MKPKIDRRLLTIWMQTYQPELLENTQRIFNRIVDTVTRQMNDGYNRAKWLEQFYDWRPNAELVAILSGKKTLDDEKYINDIE